MTASTQSCPGTIQLANALASGLAVESVAYAKMGQALGNYSDSASLHAQDEYVQGQKMSNVSNILTDIQWAIGVVSVLLFVAGGAAALVASEAISAAADAGIGATQGLIGATQGGMQAYKSDLQATTEIDSTAVTAIGKASDTSSTAIKSESQGAGKLGSAINTMLINEGAIEKQKITK